jgi:hypothetical protein
MESVMKQIISALTALGMLAMSGPASATWMQGTVLEVRVIANGNASDKILVFTNAPTGCSPNAFMLFPTDPFFSQSYALLLSAKSTGMQIKFDHSYCDPTLGYARGNGYSLVD